jgi:hypothetical protein
MNIRPYDQSTGVSTKLRVGQISVGQIIFDEMVFDEMTGATTKQVGVGTFGQEGGFFQGIKVNSKNPGACIINLRYIRNLFRTELS